MFYENVLESVEMIKSHLSLTPRVGIILGSGLAGLENDLKDKKVIDYEDIPHFPKSKVEGHQGQLIVGKIGSTEVLLWSGRFHYYEGFTMKQVTYPIFCMKLLGIEKIIVTNACGAINTDFKPGDLLLIEDFINGVSDNPLRGENDERFYSRFVDMSEPYDSDLKMKTRELSKILGIDLKEGVYAFFQGPYYETKAEIKMYSILGADVIGMSTVPETIVSNALQIPIVGISCITNMATGIRKDKHSHQEVIKIAQASSEKLKSLIMALVKAI